MIADIVAAVKAAKGKLKEQVNYTVYLIPKHEDIAGEVMHVVDEIKVTGIRIDGDVLNVIIEYENGDVDEVPLTEFANRTYATQEAAKREIYRRLKERREKL